MVMVWSPANHGEIHYEHRKVYHRLLKILYLINLSYLPQCSDKFLGSGKYKHSDITTKTWRENSDFTVSD